MQNFYKRTCAINVRKGFTALPVMLLFMMCSAWSMKGMAQAFNVFVSTTTNVTCPGAADGSVAFFINGGTPPYNYTINCPSCGGGINGIDFGGGSPNNQGGLSPDNYNIFVTDASGGSNSPAFTSFLITSPPAFADNTTIVNDCSGSGTGSISLTLTGGTPSYSYAWSNGLTDSFITGLLAGSYTVNISDAIGCGTSYSYTVGNDVGSPTPTIASSGTTTFCAGGSVTLTANGGSGTNYAYLWTTTETTVAITVSPTNTTTYSVTVTNGCASAAASQAITVNSLPTATITQAVGCVTTTLTAGTGTSYKWDNSSTTNPRIVNSSGTYTVTVTNGSGCTASKSFVATVNSSPTAVITPSGTTTFCTGGSVTLTASGGTSYLWNVGGSTSAAITVSPMITRTYRVTVSNSCGSGTAKQVVTISNTPMVSITPSTTTSICVGNNVTLTANGSGNFLWSTNETTAAITVTPTTTTTYTVTLTASCGSTTASEIVMVNATPTLTISPTGTASICPGNNITLTANGTGTYLWDNTATTASIIVSPTTTTTYTVTLTGACGSTTASKIVTVNTPAVSISPSGPTSLCPGNNITLTANGTGTYLWNTAATSAIITVTPTATTTYTVTLTNGCGSTTASQVVTVNATPTVSITPSGSTAICPGTSITLTANGTGTYLWSTAATSAAITVTPTANTIYTVTLTNSNGCTALTGVMITINSPPSAAITAGTTTTFCSGGSVVLTAGGGGSYAWNVGGVTTASITANPTVTTTYIVSVSNSCGTNTAGQVVTVNPLPTVFINASAPAISCVGGNVIIRASGGTSYLWNNGATTTTIAVSTAGTYKVTVSNGLCTSTSKITINNPAVLNYNITVKNTSCDLNNGKAYMTVTSGVAPFHYVWSTGSTIDTIANLSPGKYYVTVMANGCTKTDSVTIIKGTNPFMGIVPAATSCSNDNGSAAAHVYSGVPPYKYYWSNGATAALITGLSASNYSVTVTDAQGCIITGSTTISLINIQLTTYSAVTTCGLNNGAASVSILNGISPYQYNWNTGATTQAVNDLAKGTYSVVVQDGRGCTAAASVLIGGSTTPSIHITPLIRNTSCAGGHDGAIQLAVTGGQTPYTFHWSTGVTTQNTSNVTTGTYTVSVSDFGGCTAVQTVTITANGTYTPSVTALTTTTVCRGDTVKLKAGAGQSYRWSNGVTTQNISIVKSGSYQVTVSNTAGCGGVSTPVNVVINPLPTASITTNKTNDTLIAGVSASYQWYYNNQVIHGGVQRKQAATQSGVYRVMVVDPNGCSNVSDTLRVTHTTTGLAALGSQNNNTTINVFPNPFSNHFTVQYPISTEDIVSITLLDLTGRIIAVPVAAEKQSKGLHEVVVDITTLNLKQGLYFVKFVAGNKTQVQKVNLILE